METNAAAPVCEFVESSSSQLLEQISDAVATRVSEEFKRAREADRSMTLSLSKINTEQLNTLRREFSEYTVFNNADPPLFPHLPRSSPKESPTTPFFEWDRAQEGSTVNMAAAIARLQSLIPLSGRRRWLDVSSQRLLNFDWMGESRIKFTGKTGVIVVESTQTCDIFNSVIMIELKRDASQGNESSAERQALGEILTAALMRDSAGKTPLPLILTDLNNFTLFWFHNKKLQRTYWPFGMIDTAARELHHFISSLPPIVSFLSQPPSPPHGLGDDDKRDDDDGDGGASDGDREAEDEKDTPDGCRRQVRKKRCENGCSTTKEGRGSGGGNQLSELTIADIEHGLWMLRRHPTMLQAYGFPRTYDETFSFDLPTREDAPAG